MQSTTEPVERHYTREDTLGTILSALRSAEKDVSRLVPADLAPVDEFHIRGREATVELAQRAGLSRGMRVLDVGSGLGGSARYLASECGCRVTGVDLTQEYVTVARELTRLVGLGDAVDYHAASALELPFDEGTFDVVWTEHAQMNIGDKQRLYGGIKRVLRPGGRLVFHDFFQGPGGDPYFPVPWAGDPSISFLAKPEHVRELLAQLGFRIVDWVDKTAESRDWLAWKMAQPKSPLGLQLLMGPTTPVKFDNVVRGLREDRLAVVQAVAERIR